MQQQVIPRRTCSLIQGKQYFIAPSAPIPAQKVAVLESTCEATLVQKPYSCEQCDFSCTKASYLKQHLVTHSREKLLSCYQCSASFARRAHLKQHMTTHSGERHFTFDQCNYSCNQAGHLRRQMMQHSGLKPFAVQLHLHPIGTFWGLTCFHTLEKTPICARNAITLANSLVIWRDTWKK